MGPCMHEFQIPYCTTVWEATNEFPPGGGGGWVPPLAHVEVTEVPSHVRLGGNHIPIKYQL